ncbi:MAG: MFS transporter [Dehalococcoidia bacterium]|nr:MFS transporter [Dehalococcoidia bacterium]
MRETTQAVAGPPEEVARERSWGLMIGLSAGHAVKHFYQQAFLLLIPAVKVALGLTDVQVGVIGMSRTFFSAAVNIPAGFVGDMWRSKVALILAGSLSSLALGYFLIGIYPSYWLLLLGVAITGVGTSLWHAPAFGTLAALYPQRRAFAMSVHRMGGSIGDSISPVVMGVLLGGFAFWGLEWGGMGWRALALALVAPALVSAATVLLAHKSLKRSGGGTTDMRTYVRSAVALFKNATVLGMVMLASVRAMAHNGLSIFLILYMSEDLHFSAFKVGYHVALLTLFGILFAPVMGWASDKFGPRPVIFLGLLAITVLILALLPFGAGWTFTVILALLGLFLYTVNPVMLAAAMESTKRGTESSITALMFTGQAVFGAISPVIAGWLRQHYSMDAVFYYSGAIVAAITVATLFIPMRKAES